MPEEKIISIEQKLGFCFPRPIGRMSPDELHPTVLDFRSDIDQLIRRFRAYKSTAIRRDVEFQRQCEDIFSRHGRFLWPSSSKDRSQWLVTAELENYNGLYPRDLYFENNEDRETLRKLCLQLLLKRFLRYISNHRPQPVGRPVNEEPNESSEHPAGSSSNGEAIHSTSSLGTNARNSPPSSAQGHTSAPRHSPNSFVRHTPIPDMSQMVPGAASSETEQAAFAAPVAQMVPASEVARHILEILRHDHAADTREFNTDHISIGMEDTNPSDLDVDTEDRENHSALFENIQVSAKRPVSGIEAFHESKTTRKRQHVDGGPSLRPLKISKLRIPPHKLRSFPESHHDNTSNPSLDNQQADRQTHNDVEDREAWIDGSATNPIDLTSPQDAGVQSPTIPAPNDAYDCTPVYERASSLPTRDGPHRHTEHGDHARPTAMTSISPNEDHSYEETGAFRSAYRNDSKKRTPEATPEAVRMDTSVHEHAASIHNDAYPEASPVLTSGRSQSTDSDSIGSSSSAPATAIATPPTPLSASNSNTSEQQQLPLRGRTGVAQAIVRVYWNAESDCPDIIALSKCKSCKAFFTHIEQRRPSHEHRAIKAVRVRLINGEIAGIEENPNCRIPRERGREAFKYLIDALTGYNKRVRPILRVSIEF